MGIVNVNGKIGGSIIELFGNVPISHITAVKRRQIAERQEHIVNTGVELLRKASGGLFHRRCEQVPLRKKCLVVVLIVGQDCSCQAKL